MIGPVLYNHHAFCTALAFQPCLSLWSKAFSFSMAYASMTLFSARRGPMRRQHNLKAGASDDNYHCTNS